jgi:hypothetical protein
MCYQPLREIKLEIGEYNLFGDAKHENPAKEKRLWIFLNNVNQISSIKYRQSNILTGSFEKSPLKPVYSFAVIGMKTLGKPLSTKNRRKYVQNSIKPAALNCDARATTFHT